MAVPRTLGASVPWGLIGKIRVDLALQYCVEEGEEDGEEREEGYLIFLEETNICKSSGHGKEHHLFKTGKVNGAVVKDEMKKVHTMTGLVMS